MNKDSIGSTYHETGFSVQEFESAVVRFRDIVRDSLP